MELYLVTFSLLTGYLIGSIPTAVWVGKMKYGIDVRDHGSNNAGATNTFRVLGKKPGIVVLLIDILKGIIAVGIPLLVSMQFTSTKQELVMNYELIGGCSAIFGHILPVFAQFKGGKGVATSLGVVIALHPMAAGISIFVFLITFLISNFVSLGAILGAIAFPLVLALFFEVESVPFSIFSIVLAVAVIFAHRQNIGRLLAGNENKMNLFRK
jgi:glycerol-3-phosphate acyltransferase PlsY